MDGSKCSHVAPSSDGLKRLLPIPIGLSLRNYILGNYFQKWVILGSLIGLVAGAGAIAFYESIHIASSFFLVDLAGYHQPLASGEGSTVIGHATRPWAFPLILTLGGLISGVIVYTLAPEAEGHGTDVAIGAFHQKAGRIRERIPAVKLVASAITIGSGGSAGREGPTAEIAAGFGSWLGEVFHLSDADRRIALAVGIGAGIGAIFKAPLGGAILSAEILYIRDFEIEALVPGFIASVIGYCVFAAWAGWQPVFGSGADLSFHQPEELTWYFVLGMLCGVAGILYARSFYATRDFFRRIRIPNHVKPAIGGLGVGLIALVYPQILAMGYGWLQIAIDGNLADLTLKTMLALIFVKMIATALTVGSGGSGGVFAPGLFIGGMLGGGLWGLLHTHVGWMPDSPAPYVIVGMMALFGGVAKAPIAVILMVAEMTNEFSLVIPAMLATTLAYLVTGDVAHLREPGQPPRRFAGPQRRERRAVAPVPHGRGRDAQRRRRHESRYVDDRRREADQPVGRPRLPGAGERRTGRHLHHQGRPDCRATWPRHRRRRHDPRPQGRPPDRQPARRPAAHDVSRHLAPACGRPAAAEAPARRRQRARHRDRSREAAANGLVGSEHSAEDAAINAGGEAFATLRYAT